MQITHASECKRTFQVGQQRHREEWWVAFSKFGVLSSGTGESKWEKTLCPSWALLVERESPSSCKMCAKSARQNSGHGNRPLSQEVWMCFCPSVQCPGRQLAKNLLLQLWLLESHGTQASPSDQSFLISPFSQTYKTAVYYENHHLPNTTGKASHLVTICSSLCSKPITPTFIRAIVIF